MPGNQLDHKQHSLDPSAQGYFRRLPKEISRHVFSFLPPQVVARLLVLSKDFKQILSEPARWISYLKQETNYVCQPDEDPITLFGKLQILKQLHSLKLAKVFFASNNPQEKALIRSTKVLFDRYTDTWDQFVDRLLKGVTKPEDIRIISENVYLDKLKILDSGFFLLKSLIINTPASGTVIRNNLYLQEILKQEILKYFPSDGLLGIAKKNFEAGKAILEIAGLCDELPEGVLEQLIKENFLYFKVILDNPAPRSKFCIESNYQQFYLLSNLRKVMDPLIDALADQMLKENELAAVVQQWMALVEDKPLVSNSAGANELQDLLKLAAELPYVWPKKYHTFLEVLLSSDDRRVKVCRATLPIYIKQSILERIKKYQNTSLRQPILHLNEQWLNWQQQKLEATKKSAIHEFGDCFFYCKVFAIYTVLLPVYVAAQFVEQCMGYRSGIFWGILAYFSVAILSLIGLPSYALFIAALPVMAVGLAVTKISAVVRGCIKSFVANRAVVEKHKAYLESLQQDNSSQASPDSNTGNPYACSELQPCPASRKKEELSKGETPKDSFQAQANSGMQGITLTSDAPTLAIPRPG